jgi:hypothetical protein
MLQTSTLQHAAPAAPDSNAGLWRKQQQQQQQTQQRPAQQQQQTWMETAPQMS